MSFILFVFCVFIGNLVSSYTLGVSKNINKYGFRWMKKLNEEGYLNEYEYREQLSSLKKMKFISYFSYSVVLFLVAFFFIKFLLAFLCGTIIMFLNSVKAEFYVENVINSLKLVNNKELNDDEVNRIKDLLLKNE